MTRARRQSFHVVMKMLVSPADQLCRFEQNTKVEPSGDHIGKPSNSSE